MPGHVGTEDLEKLFLAPESIVMEERKQIDAHLAQCALCREQMEALSEVYSGLPAGLSEPPLQRDEAVARRILDPSRKEELPGQLLQLPPHREGSLDLFGREGRRARRPVALARVVHYMRSHPVRFAGGMSLAAALCVFAVMAVRGPAGDANPVYAKIQDFVLTVYNKEGLPLWTKGVPGFPDITSERRPIVHVTWRDQVAVEDIDGDGRSEVLVIGAESSPGFAMDTLYCYDGDGSLRWRSGVGPLADFGNPGQVHHSKSAIRAFMSFRKSPADSIRLFVLAIDRYLSPSKLYEVSATDGRELHAYHHKGQCILLLHSDVDADGNEELVMAGINDGFDRAAMAVLDPSNIDGYAPVPPQLVPRDLKKAAEKQYMLFPLSRLAQDYRRVLYNTPLLISVNDRREILITISELLLLDLSIPENAIHFLYTFDHGMKVAAVSGTDGFLNFHDWLLKTGKIRKSAIPACYDELRDSIKYWDGERFVGWGDLEPKFPKGGVTLEH